MRYLPNIIFIFLLSKVVVIAQEEMPFFELDPFVVTVETATRTPRLLSDVPIKTEVLCADAFDMGVRTSLGEAIELLNGVRTERDCQNCDTAQIQLLGLPGNYNQILVDGQPLFTGVASVYGIDQVPTIFVERLEVVKGGGSVLYGPGAVAGVVNIIPHEPFYTHSHLQYDFRSVDGAVGNEFQFEQAFLSEHLPLKGTVYGLLGNQNDYDRNSDGFSDLTRTYNGTIGTYLWWIPTDRTRVCANYQLIYEDRRGGDNLDGQNQFSQISEELLTNYHWATLSLDHELTERFNVSLSGSIVYLERDSFYGGTGTEEIDPSLVSVTAQNPVNGTYNGAAPVDGGTPDQQRAFALFGDGTGIGGGSYNQFGILDSTTYLLNAQGNYDFSDTVSYLHVLTFGVQYEHEKLFDENVNAFGNRVSILHDEEFSTLGFYLQDQWQLNDRLEFVPGMRIDKASTLDNIVVSPRIATRFTATDELTLRGNFSTGFLAPRIFSEDTHIDNLGGRPIDVNNADGLTEERSYTFSLGADYTPAILAGNLTTAIQSYYTILRDSFTIDPTDTTPSEARGTFLRVNTSGSTVFGVEWDLAWSIHRNWRLDMGLAYIRTRYDEAQILADDGVTAVLSNHYNKTPDWTGLIQLNYLHESLFNAFAGLKWTGVMQVARNAPTADVIESNPFYVVDIGISRALNFTGVDVIAKAGINNVLDDFQDDLQSGPDRDSDYVYGPRFPRTYYASLSLDF